MTSNNNKIDKKVINYDVVYSSTGISKIKMADFEEFLNEFEKEFITSLLFEMYNEIKAQNKELIIYSYLNFSEWQKIKNKLQENKIEFWEYPDNSKGKNRLSKLLNLLLPKKVHVQCKIKAPQQLNILLTYLWPLWEFIIRICDSSNTDISKSLESWNFSWTIPIELLNSNLLIFWKFYDGAYIEIKTKYINQIDLINIIKKQSNNFKNIELVEYDYDYI